MLQRSSPGGTGARQAGAGVLSRPPTPLVAILAIALAACLVGLPGPALGAVRPAEAASDQPPGAISPGKAVVVVGPVGGLTSQYLERGRAVAAAAERNGMEVVRIFHPKATWRRVVAAAQGANLLVYLGHGNGWPSPHKPFQEDTKNGLGLNPTYGETDTHKVRYWGADHVRAEIRLAPNAIVILNKSCYAAGNGENHHPVPTRAVARERVDNYAAGFLAAGARTVFAFTWQPPGEVIDALFSRTATMDQIFMLRFGGGEPHPWSGWVGWRPDLYFDSVRTPGARLRLDPHREYGYLRSIAGDLAMTTSEWLSAAEPLPDDTTPPEISELAADRPAGTFVPSDSGPEVFTPNGDGVSDLLRLRYRLSESSSLRVSVERVSNGNIVRTLSGWSSSGRGSLAWDGRKDTGEIASDGRYRIHVTPTDRAGNVGETARLVVRVLTALKAPAASPALFDSTDGDAIGSTTFRARLTRPATITWQVLDASGQLVRTGISDQEVTDARTTFTWDGLDDQGLPVARGTYRARVSATTAQGTYAHVTSVKVMPFLMTASTWTLKRGQTAKLRITAAEAVAGKPVISVKQPGLEAFRLRVTKVSSTSFTASLKARSGGSTGRIRIFISSIDESGGSQEQKYVLKLR